MVSGKRKNPVRQVNQKRKKKAHKPAADAVPKRNAAMYYIISFFSGMGAAEVAIKEIKEENEEVNAKVGLVVEIKKKLLSFVQFLTGALATENICEPLNLNQYLDANHNHIPLFVIGSPCDGIANSGFKGGLTTSSSALFEMAIKHINSLSR